jgi:hypothetical protein
MSGTTNNQIFDNYEVNCNDCGHYWNDSCDGVPLNQKRNCTSFIATKTTDIPKQIKQLKTDLRITRFIVILILLTRIVGFFL